MTTIVSRAQAALTTRLAGDRVQLRTGSRGRCCQGVAWWRSTGSSQQWSVLWTSTGGNGKTSRQLKDILLRRPHCLVYTGQCRFFSSTFTQKTDHFKEKQTWHTHPVNLLGVQVPHLDHLTSRKQQFSIRAHTEAGHCWSVRLPLTVW